MRIVCSSISKISSFSDYDKTRCAIPLFHGTRMRALEVNKQQRQEFVDACDAIIVFGNKIANNLPRDAVQQYKKNKNGSYFGSVSSLSYKKARNYEYGDFYITSSFGTAAYCYTKNGGGELGEMAFQNAIALLDLNISLTDDMKQKIQIVIEEHKKYIESNPIVLAVTGVRFEDLLTINGGIFINDVEEDKDIIEFLYDYIDSEKSINPQSFRLLNIDEYEFYLIKESDFDDGIKRFTKVTNIDEYKKFLLW